MAVQFVPVALAAGVIRMVAPTVARALIKSGVAKEATKKALDSMKGYIPKATRKEAENLARTSSKEKTPTSAPRPKPNPASAARGAGNAAARAKKDKENQKEITKNLNKRNLPTKTNRPLTTTGGRNLTGAARRKELREQKQNLNKEKVSVNKSGAAASSRASQIGPTGLASLDKKKEQDKKLKPVPEVNVRTLPEPKKVRPAPKKGDNEELNINPKRKKPSKDKKADDGYRFYGKKGTGLGDFSRKYGMKYATQKQFEKDFDMSGGAKKGGSIKKLAKKKRKGFSGRGAGKALRGF
tara:strand:- start:156 stop:1046 length:891 start_codon:yes stop_codon:yes gene_type:complete